jgi:hypothetical protein
VPDERRQFRVLFRDFLFRLVDVEILSSEGEIQKLLAQFAAMLGAFSFVLTIWFVPNVGRAGLPHDKLMVAVGPLVEFLIASTMAIAGLFTVLAWNAVLPDRRDCLVLGLLPLRVRTIALAKIAGIAAALGISIVATNSFTGLSFPFVLGGLRTASAWWLTMILAGVFACCALLSYRLFLRVSSWVQMAAFFAILGAYFLKPPHMAPFSWFFGLFQELNGTASADLAVLAARGLLGLAIAFATTVLTFALAYQRNLRRIVEQPDIAPADRSRRATRIGSFLAAHLLARPMERAILLFTARTIGRSRQHRLLLAAYAGIGLAIALAYARDLLYGTTAFDRPYPDEPWNQLNGPFLAGSLVLLFFAIVGARAVFAMPMALRANWIFRVTAVHAPADYFRAARKALFAVAAAPVWIGAAILFFTIWPVRPAAEHIAVLMIIGTLIGEIALYRFGKIPFACSYLPGKANIHVRLGAGGIGFLFAASQGVQLEYWAMQRPRRFAILAGILTIFAIWAWRRTAAWSAHPSNHVQFEDLPPSDVQALNLRTDGGEISGAVSS